MSSTSKNRPDNLNIPMSMAIYVKEGFPVELIMDLIEGSQDDVCKTQFSLKTMFLSRTETSIIWFPADWVGPPKSVVRVDVDVEVDIEPGAAIRSYISQL